jgi:hypothetical protein
MIVRRAVLAAPLALIASVSRAATGEPMNDRLSFSVLRKGSAIGTHAITFKRAGNVLEAHIDVSMSVGIGPITLFRYRMTGVETWREDRLAEIETTTDNDGEKLRVVARRGAAGVVVDSATLGRATLPAEALPLTHWNIRCMSASLFNPQDGKPMQLAVRPLGATRVALAGGALVDATRFSLTGESTLDDWYDTNSVWTALRAVATDGSIIEYRRTA